MADLGGSGSLRRSLNGFTNRLTLAEKENFQLSTLEDVYDTINDIQRAQGDEKKMRNFTRISAFTEGMQEYGKVIEVFVNSSNTLAFVWVSRATLSVTDN